MLVQVMFWVEPTRQFSPPFGKVITIDFCSTNSIVNTPSEESLTALFLKSLILTLHWVDGVLGTVHANVPRLALTESFTVVQLFPLFVVNSIFTESIFELLHLIVSTSPTFQFSPPLGEVTVMLWTTTLVIAKLLSLISLTVELVTSLILTLLVVDGAFGIVQT